MDQRPDIGGQYRPTDGDADAGIYRVVGTTGETVTLLKVGDAEDRRVHTGDIESVPRTTFDAAFTSAPSPDAASKLPRALAGVAVGFVVVAALSWGGVLTTPAPPDTLAAMGVLLYAAGRLADRFDLAVPFR
jgi:hypothetical protein